MLRLVLLPHNPSIAPMEVIQHDSTPINVNLDGVLHLRRLWQDLRTETKWYCQVRSWGRVLLVSLLRKIFSKMLCVLNCLLYYFSKSPFLETVLDYATTSLHIALLCFCLFYNADAVNADTASFTSSVLTRVSSQLIECCIWSGGVYCRLSQPWLFQWSNSKRGRLPSNNVNYVLTRRS